MLRQQNSKTLDSTRALGRAPNTVYTEDEWIAAAGHNPLAGLEIEDLMLVHRHWMWCNQLRERLDQELLQGGGADAGLAPLATRTTGFMFCWYAMLWSVIEACLDPAEGRSIDLRGRLRADIDSISKDLRLFRNAILHVPRRGGYYDPRLVALVEKPDAVAVLRRIHNAFGRLFLEELPRRKGHGNH